MFLSRSVMSDHLPPHGLQYAGLPCPLPSPQSLLKYMPTELMTPFSHLISCHPLLHLPSIFPSIRFFSSESALCTKRPMYCSFTFSINPSNEYSGLISFRIHWFDLLAFQGTLKSLFQHRSLKATILQCSVFFMVQLSTVVHDYWKNHSFDYADLYQQSDVSAF